jgi:hypothetical protein
MRSLPLMASHRDFGRDAFLVDGRLTGIGLLKSAPEELVVCRKESVTGKGLRFGKSRAESAVRW